MPLYEFQCKECKHVFERMQKVSDPEPPCPQCGSAVEQLISPPAVQFKGSGWYVTDYARKGGGNSGGPKHEGKSDPAAGSGTTKESKPSKDSGDK